MTHKKNKNQNNEEKKYANPFFAHKKKKKSQIKIPNNLKLFFSMIFIILIACFWFVFYSAYFTINEINVIGEGKISTSTVLQIAWEEVNDRMFVMMPHRNLVFFNEKKILEKLEEQKYVFDYFVVEKARPNTMNIKFREKECSIVWNEDDKYFYMDENASIITEITPLDIQEKKYPLVENKTDLKISDNKTPIDVKYIQYSIDLFKELIFYKEDFMIEKFVIENQNNTIKLIITNGPYVLFDIDNDAKKQVEKLVLVRRKKLKDTFSETEYVDVRIGNSVYYK